MIFEPQCVTYTLRMRIDCPTRHRIGHLGDVLLSQSLGLILNPTQQIFPF